MLDIIRKLFSTQNTQPATGSKEVAKERLRLVLVHDRSQVSPQYMGLLKKDMAKAVSTYMDINPEDMEVNLNREDQAVTLVANIPVSAVKRSPAPSPEPCMTMTEGLTEYAVETSILPPIVNCMIMTERLTEHAEPTTAEEP